MTDVGEYSATERNPWCQANKISKLGLLFMQNDSKDVVTLANTPSDILAIRPGVAHRAREGNMLDINQLKAGYVPPGSREESFRKRCQA